MPVDTRRQNERLGGVSHHRATEVSRQDSQDCAHIPTFRVFRVFRGKKGLEAGGGTAASPSTQGREAAAPPAHANLGAMVLATKNTKSAFFSAFSAISAVKNNAAEVFVFNRKERRAVQLVFWTGLQDSQD